MRKANLILMGFILFAGILAISGCATTDMRGVNRILCQETDAGTDRAVFILEKDNDLYFRYQAGDIVPFRVNYTDRRLTNTPSVVKTDVHVWSSGCITYFANDGNGGHWYMQPLNGDDTNKKVISAEDMMKMGK